MPLSETAGVAMATSAAGGECVGSTKAFLMMPVHPLTRRDSDNAPCKLQEFLSIFKGILLQVYGAAKKSEDIGISDGNPHCIDL